jgi:protein phosphatase
VEKYAAAHPLAAAHRGGRVDDALVEYFLGCLREINADILAFSMLEPGNIGMATTAVIAHVFGGRLYVVNLGDSRAYMIRNGAISQITVDHTTVNDMVLSGVLTPEEAREHPRKNEITRALGAFVDVVPDFFVTKTLPGDRVVMCTDGLYGELADDEIRRIVSEGADLNKTCESLVSRANNKGGRDNITVICLEIQE